MSKAISKRDIKANNESGFTLIDISIALIILSIIAVPFIWQYNLDQKKRITKYGDRKIGAVSKSIQGYISANGRYPFPADPTLTVADAGHGREIAVGAIPGDGLCTGVGGTGVCAAIGENTVAGTGTVGRVITGSVPYVALGISPEDAVDYWGSTFTYAVSFDVANATIINNGATGRPYTYEDLGAITIIKDAPSPPVNNIQAVLIAHGVNRHGSYILATGDEWACEAAKLDTENCDRDAAFLQSGLFGNAGNANDYDDDVRVNFSLSEGVSWSRLGMSSNIRLMAQDRPERVGLGTQDPDERLHVIGNVAVDKSQSMQMCDEDGNDCFPADVIGGGGIDCPSGQLMVGTTTSGGVITAVCRAPNFPMRGTDITCPPLQYVVGIHYNAVTMAVELDCESP